MTHKKSILFAAVFALVGVTALSSSAFAHDDTDHKHHVAQHEQRPATMLSEEQKQKVEERKTALQEKLTAAKEARQNKLEGKRLATCEKRSSKINSILAHGTDQSRKHLAVFQKIEERVKQFYANKNLTADGYDTAVTNADEKEAAAVAAIETSTETTFNCENADGAKPGDAIRELMKSRHQALKEYRTAIKDLILVVKKGHGQQQTTSEPAETESTTEEEQ